MTDLAALVVRMQADNSAYVKALDQATSKLQKFSKDQSELLLEVAGKFAAAFSVEKILEFTKSSIEAEASLDKLSQSAGISVESLSSLKLAAAASGLSTDDLGLAFKKLNVNIAQAAGDGSSKAGIAFKAMGISVTDASGKVKSADAIFAELATKFAGYADGPNKTAIAVELLGRQGQNLIPVLNKGAAGLEEFRAKAEAAGLVISGQAAKAAEEFEQKAAVLKSTLIDGLGIQLTAKLLPALDGMVTAFESGGTAGESMSVVADEIATALKLIASIGLGVGFVIQSIGDGIGALVAKGAALASGDLVAYAQISDDALAQQVDRTKKFADLQAAIWHKETADEMAEAKAKYELFAYLDKNKPAAPNTTAAGAGEAALKELEKYADGIKDQALAFGLGGAALTKYKLQFGPLADAIKKAGAEGQAVAASAQKWANVLQFKVDTKTTNAVTDSLKEQIALYDLGDVAAEKYKLSHGEIGKAYDREGAAGEKARQEALALQATITQRKDDNAIKAIDDQTLLLTGHLNAAALSAFDLQNRALKTNLTAANDTGGLDKLAAQRSQVDAQSQINELNLKASQINTDLALSEAKISAAVANGQTSELAGDNQIAAARSNALEQLQAINTQEQQIAATSGSTNIALVDGVKKFGSSLVALQTQTHETENKVRGDLENAFVNPLLEAETSSKSFKAAFSDMIKSIQKDLLTIANKNLADSIFGSGGAGGGIAPFIAGLLGGGAGAGNGLSASANASIAATGSGSTDAALEALAGSGLADGGTIPAGGMRLVGEKGPELAYAGNANMNIVPMSQGKSTVIHLTNVFQVPPGPGGTISRPSQMQQTAMVGRALQQATRRNTG